MSRQRQQAGGPRYEDVNQVMPGLRGWMDSDPSLNGVDWYWPDLTREEANERLQNEPDGSFLVRNSTSPGEFTLVLRNNGANKCIKILHRDGKYGFIEPCTFTSVKDLITHYQENSLQIYNRTLNTRLLTPICHDTNMWLSADDVTNSLYTKLARLVEINKHYQIKYREYSCKFEEHATVYAEIGRIHSVLLGLGKALSMYENHVQLHQSFAHSVKPDEEQMMAQNLKTLEARIRHFQEIRQQQERIQQQNVHKQNNLNNELCSMVPELKQLGQNRDELKRNVLRERISAEFVYGLLEEERDERLSHTNECNWLVSVDREGACRLLAGKPHGTFLIRPKSEPQIQVTHVLSIMCREKVKHCKIMMVPGRGYGFTPDLCLFPTLVDLVVKYRRISLAEHNEGADVTLIYPVHQYR